MKNRLQLNLSPGIKLSQRLTKAIAATTISIGLIASVIFFYLNFANPDHATAFEKNDKQEWVESNCFNLNKVIKVGRLPGSINSGYIELNPIIADNGATLFFGRKKHPKNSGGEEDYDDIWISRYDFVNDTWMAPENLAELNNPGPNFIVDGTMTQDASIIVMSISRGDSYGNRDLYVMFREGEDKWSAPINMGSAVNSAQEEATPFISHNTEYLYFSSRGHEGFGGSDIFISKRLDDTWTNWSIPENLGSKINSRYDEEYFHIPATGNYAYFTRGVKDIDMDIFRAEIGQLHSNEEYVLN